MRRDLLFETARFDLSVVGAHFINPCCFGEDAAAWLRARLVERGVDAGAPFQEDWGWGLGATHAGGRYFVRELLQREPDFARVRGDDDES